MAVTDTHPSAVVHRPRSERHPVASSTRAGTAVVDRRDPRATDSGGGIRSLYALLTLVLVVYAGSLVVRGPNGASPTWLDGWGVAVFELVCSLLVLMRAYTSARDRK